MIFKREKIKSQMRLKGISQKDLADRLDVTPRTVNRWMRGSQTIPQKYHEKLAVILDFDLYSDELGDVSRSFPPEKLKRISGVVPHNVSNELYFIENWMGISRDHLFWMLPRMIRVVAELAFERETEELQKIEELEKKLPSGWGPQTETAQKFFNSRKERIANGNPYQNTAAIFAFLMQRGIHFGLGLGGPQKFLLATNFGDELNNIIGICISEGHIDVSKVDWALWGKEENEDLKIVLIETAYENFRSVITELKNKDEDHFIERQDRFHSLGILLRELINDSTHLVLTKYSITDIANFVEAAIVDFADLEEFETLEANLKTANMKGFLEHKINLATKDSEEKRK